MPHPIIRGLLCAPLLSPLVLNATPLDSQDAEIAELRTMIEQMRSQYERRIADLESRLAQSDPKAAQRHVTASSAPSLALTAPAAPPETQVPTARPADRLGTLDSGSGFNPRISVILDGNYYQDGIDGEGATLMGLAFMPGRAQHVHEEDETAHDHAGHVHGAMENGFNFREAELAFSATVDPWFDASLYTAIDDDGTVELEEAWFQTRSLPYGLRVKGGKFLSDFGYINRQHPHQWDFVDQNLPYLNLLGDHGLQDTGLQLTWVPELPFYTLLGAEALQGDQEQFGVLVDEAEQVELNLGDSDDGPRLWTAFAKVSPEIGENQALQFGVSYAHATQHQEVHTHTHPTADEEAPGEGGDPVHAHEDGETDELVVHETGLAGDADLWGLDLVYKFDGDGADGHRDFKLQAEYLRSIKHLSVHSSAHAEQIGSDRDLTTDGLYVQALYGFAPKWSAGIRYDVLGLTNEVSGGKNADFGSSDRWTLGLTWDLSEFSRLRAQYARNDILVTETERERFDAFYLQFVMSLGAHGAHGF